MRKAQMDTGLSQREVATSIWVSEWAIHNWETNTHQSAVAFSHHGQ